MLDRLLDLTDNDLMDLIFCRAPAEKEQGLGEQARHVLGLLRSV